MATRNTTSENIFHFMRWYKVTPGTVISDLPVCDDNTPDYLIKSIQTESAEDITTEGGFYFETEDA